MGGSSAPETMAPWKQQFQKYAGPAAKAWLLVRVVLAVVTILGVAIVATNSTRLAAIENVSKDFSEMSVPQGELVRQTEAAISTTYRTNTPPMPEELNEIRESAGQVLAALTGFEAPNRALRQSRDGYRRALERLMGVINSYDGSVEDYEAFQNASVELANIGGEFRDSVERFTGGTWRSFWGVW